MRILLKGFPYQKQVHRKCLSRVSMQKPMSMNLDAILSQQQCLVAMSVHYQFCRYKRCRIEGSYKMLS